MDAVKRKKDDTVKKHKTWIFYYFVILGFACFYIVNYNKIILN